MNLNLIHTENYLLLTDKDAEIKENDLFYPLDKNVSMGITRKTPLYIKYMHTRNCVKIVAYYPLTKEAKELDLPLLPNPFKEGVDVEKLSHRYYSDLEEKREKAKNFKGQVAGRHPDMLTSKKYAAMGGFVDGYKAAQSKQFSLEDMINAAKYGYEFRDTTSFPEHKFEDSCINNFKQKLQSISTQQLLKEFIPEYVNEPIYIGDGCHKDDWILKTITNSEGKEELVGYYQY